MSGTWSDLGFTRQPITFLLMGLFLGLVLQGLNYGLKFWLAGGAQFTLAMPTATSLGTWLIFFVWFVFCLIVNSINEDRVSFPIGI